MIRVFVSPDSGYSEAQARSDIKRTCPALDYSLDFFRFDGFQDSLVDLVAAAQAPSFSGTPKVLLLTDAYFLTDAKTKGLQSEEDLKVFGDYLKKPEPDCRLFICLEGKLGRNALCKALRASGADFIDLTLPEGEALAMEGMKLASENGKNIDRDSALEVVRRTGNDYRAFVKTMDTLCLYTDAIRLPDVDALVPRRLEDNVFAIADALMSFRPLEALRDYRDLRKGGLDPIGFLPVLFAQFRFMAQVAYLSGRKLNDDRIADELGCRPGRVYMNKRKLNGMGFAALVDVLADLGRIERGIKFDLDDPDATLEFFFLGFRAKFRRAG